MKEIETIHCSTIREAIIVNDRMIIMPTSEPIGIEVHGKNKKGNTSTIIGALYSCGVYHATIEWLKPGLSIEDVHSVVNGIRAVGIKFLLDKYQYFIKPYQTMRYEDDDIEVIISPAQVDSHFNSLFIQHKASKRWLLFPPAKNIYRLSFPSFKFPSFNIEVNAKTMYLMKVMGQLLSQWEGYPFRGGMFIKEKTRKGMRKGMPLIPCDKIAKSLKTQRNISYFVETLSFFTD